MNRILVVSDYAYPAGGVEQFVRELIGYAIERDVDCRLLTWSADTLVPPGFDDLVTIECGDVRGAWHALDWADVVVVLASFNVRMLTRLATEYLRSHPTRGVAVVQTSAHSSSGNSAVLAQDRWLAELVSTADVTVAVSDAVEKALRALPDLDPLASIIVIENGSRLAAPAAPEPRGRTTVGFIGRPFPQKGYHYFARLATELQGTGLSFRANTVSLLPPEPPIAVDVCALLSDAELTAFFASTDLLVVPYTHADGLPLAVLEALNCGVPVLGFDSPAVTPLLLRHGQMVVPPFYEALRAALEAWATGALTITPPAAGQVPTWEQQFDAYFEVIRAHVPTGGRRA